MFFLHNLRSLNQFLKSEMQQMHRFSINCTRSARNRRFSAYLRISTSYYYQWHSDSVLLLRFFRNLVIFVLATIKIHFSQQEKKNLLYIYFCEEISWQRENFVFLTVESCIFAFTNFQQCIFVGKSRGSEKIFGFQPVKSALLALKTYY